MLHTVEGVVLRSHDYGESHKVVTVFTPSLGKVAFLARGAKKTRSRLASGTQVLTRGLYHFYARGQSLGTLNSCEALESYPLLKKDLLLQTYALYCLELVDRLTQEREPVAGLYNYLLLILDFLGQGKDPEVLKLLFELHILSLAGYQPHFSSCLTCGKEEGEFLFSPVEGGLLCTACHVQGGSGGGRRVSPKALRLFRLFQGFPLARLGEVKVSAHLTREMDRHLAEFIVYCLEKPLRTRSFLDQVREV